MLMCRVSVSGMKRRGLVTVDSLPSFELETGRWRWCGAARNLHSAEKNLLVRCKVMSRLTEAWTL